MRRVCGFSEVKFETINSGGGGICIQLRWKILVGFRRFLPELESRYKHGERHVLAVNMKILLGFCIRIRLLETPEFSEHIFL